MRTALGFDLRALEIFIAVCETGSMTGAAERLGMTQSAVSHAIKQLEARFDTALVDRRMRPLALTAAGTRLRHQAQQILADAQHLPRMVRERVTATLPHIRIGLVDSLATPFVPLLIRGMRPRVSSFAISSGLAVAQRQEFLTRNLDLIITNDPLEDVDGVERHEILSEPFVLLVPSKTEDFDDESAFRRFALEVPLIRSSPRTDLGRRVDQHLRRMRLDVPRVFAFDSMETIVGVVAEGLGWALLTPLCVFKSMPRPKGLKIAPFPGPGFGRPLVLVARSGELDTLPSRIANLARTILRTEYLPKLQAIAPWRKSDIKVR